MSIRKLRAGRVSTANQSEYIGEKGSIFWNELTGEFRLSDGETPGGTRVGFPVATSDLIGGVKLGPGVVLNGDGQIIIDSTGLDFNFGDFQATTEPVAPFGASLSSINANQDINIVSNGTGTVNVIGEFSVYKPDGDVAGAMAIPPIFTVKNDGQVQMLVPGADSTEGAVGIIGGLDGVFQPPVNNGVMLHITGIAGSPGVPSRVYNDAQNAFAAFVARRYNNTAAAPSAVLADEEIMRISGTAHNGTVIPGSGNQRIVYKALGNQTTSNQGGYIELWATPLNSTTIAKVATIDNANGITSTKFTGPLTGNVTGNADTVTNGVYTTGSYANPAWITSLAASKVGLGNVTNESKATMFSSPTFTGTVSGVTKAMVGLGSVENTALSTWAGSSNITTVGTLTNLVVAGTIRYDIAQSANGVQPATPTNVKTNGVTANGRSGTITTNSGPIPQSSSVTFTVSNTSVSANDVIILNIQSGAPADTYNIAVTGVRASAFDVQIRNFTNGSHSDTIVFNYAVIKVS